MATCKQISYNHRHMAHIHTLANYHDQSVTAFIIKLGDGGQKGLMHMHRTHKRLLPVGGRVGLTESLWDAVKESSQMNVSENKVYCDE